MNHAEAVAIVVAWAGQEVADLANDPFFLVLHGMLEDAERLGMLKVEGIPEPMGPIAELHAATLPRDTVVEFKTKTRSPNRAKGGYATAAAMTKQQRQDRARKGAESRKSNAKARFPSVSNQ